MQTSEITNIISYEFKVIGYVVLIVINKAGEHTIFNYPEREDKRVV